MLTSSPAKALSLCRQLHAKQIDRDGMPHFAHCMRVARRFSENDLTIIALLHDAVEDTTIGFYPIAVKFGLKIATRVLALTHAENESWDNYIARVMKYPESILVKIADIEDNMNRADEKFLRKLEKYQITLNRLKVVAEEMGILHLLK